MLHLWQYAFWFCLFNDVNYMMMNICIVQHKCMAAVWWFNWTDDRRQASSLSINDIVMSALCHVSEWHISCLFLHQMRHIACTAEECDTEKHLDVDEFRWCIFKSSRKGYWHQRADERHGKPPPRWPEAISGQRQSWKTSRRAWGKQVDGMWYFSLQCFDTVGWATGRASDL